jgi:hypothetical protein
MSVHATAAWSTHASRPSAAIRGPLFFIPRAQV